MVRKKRNKRGEAWMMVYNRLFAERASDPANPLWLRVWLVAMARTERCATGAAFAKGQLRQLLTPVDPATGETRPLSDEMVLRAIREAKRRGWITADSDSRYIRPAEGFIRPCSVDEYEDDEPEPPIDHKRNLRAIGISDGRFVS